jgi:hypothetical protein
MKKEGNRLNGKIRLRQKTGSRAKDVGGIPEKK